MRERDFIKENSVLATFTPAIMKNSAVRIGPCIPPSTTNFTRKKFTSKKTASASKNLWSVIQFFNRVKILQFSRNLDSFHWVNLWVPCPGISTLLSFVETLSPFGVNPIPVLSVERGFGSIVLPFSLSFPLATVRIVCSWSSLRKREGAEPIWLEMSGKTLSAKSVESGILEPRKSTIGSGSTTSVSSFTIGLSSVVYSWTSCLISDNADSMPGNGFGNVYCFSPSPFGALGGIGISVRWRSKMVGFWSGCLRLL